MNNLAKQFCVSAPAAPEIRDDLLVTELLTS